MLSQAFSFSHPHCRYSWENFTESYCNSLSLLLAEIVLFGFSLGFPFWVSPQGFENALLGRGFHALVKNTSFSSPTNVRSHNPLPSRLNHLAGTRSQRGQYLLAVDFGCYNYLQQIHYPNGFFILK